MAELRWTAYDTVGIAVGNGNLNNLSNNNLAIGPEINFTAAGADNKLYVDLDLILGTVNLSAKTGPAVYAWLLKSLDGTNYETGGAGSGAVAGKKPARSPDAIFAISSTSIAQRQTFRMVVTSPSKCKFLVQNVTGATFSAASASLLNYYLYSVESV